WHPSLDFVNELWFQDTSLAGLENLLIKLHVVGKILVIVGPFDDALVTAKESRRLRSDIFAHGDALKFQEHLLAFFRQDIIHEESYGVGIWGFGADHLRIDFHPCRFERHPVHERTFELFPFNRMSVGENEG